MKYNVSVYAGTVKRWTWKPIFLRQISEPSGVVDAGVDWFCLWLHLVFRPKNLPRHPLVTREASLTIAFGNWEILRF